LSGETTRASRGEQEKNKHWWDYRRFLGQRFFRASARRFRRRSRSAFEYRLGTPRASFANALAAPLLIAGILN